MTRDASGVEICCEYCYGRRLNKAGFHEERQRWQCKDCHRRGSHPIAVDDVEILTENVKLAKQRQKHMDTNRIERKAFREHARIENAYLEFTKELISVIGENKFHKVTTNTPVTTSHAGVIQLSDLHFNELVSLPHNEYSFEVAAKRLKRLADQAEIYFDSMNISNVLIACTGDLMNSDRRMDELLSNATNRSKATFLAVDLLSQFIGQIAMKYNVSVASVTGNEGRVDKEPGWSEALATHNYDYTIHRILELRFKDTDVNFIVADDLEQVVEVAGSNILLMHGHSLKAKANLDDVVTKVVGKWGARGVKVDYVIFGHIHAASIGDIYSRSSSLVGANAYSEHGLHLMSRASQNLYILDDIGNISGVKVDLQYTGDAGYEIDNALDAYNVKSSSKLKEPTVIHQIVV